MKKSKKKKKEIGNDEELMKNEKDEALETNPEIVPINENIKEQMDIIERKRKEESISAASAGSRNKLMIQICLIILVFGIYFSVFISIRLNYFTTISTCLQILEIIARREPFLSSIEFYSFEDFTTWSNFTTPENSNKLIKV